MDISFSDEFSRTTALTTASSNSHEMCFYSAPTSPSRSALSGFQTESIIPSAYEDASSNADEFEFETSRHFNLSDESNIETRKSDENPFGLMQEEQFERLQRGDSLPTMAFAEELFWDGKVLPLSPMPPLKLPPRLLHMENGDKMISPQCSTASLPRSPGSSAHRLPFPSRSLWNDNFDPFLVALDKVKEEKRGQVMCELEKEPVKKAPRSPYMPSQQPKQLRVGSDEGTLAPPLAAERKKNGTERGDFWRRKRKSDKIMKFLFGNAEMDKSSSKYKSAGLVKPEVPSQSTRQDKNATNGEMTTTALVCYKPRLLLCLGHGERYVS